MEYIQQKKSQDFESVFFLSVDLTKVFIGRKCVLHLARMDNGQNLECVMEDDNVKDMILYRILLIMDYIWLQHKVLYFVVS